MTPMAQLGRDYMFPAFEKIWRGRQGEDLTLSLSSLATMEADLWGDLNR